MPPPDVIQGWVQSSHKITRVILSLCCASTDKDFNQMVLITKKSCLHMSSFDYQLFFNFRKAKFAVAH